MNVMITQGTWNVLKGPLPQRCARLIHDDQLYVSGREDEVAGRLQRRAGAAWKEIERETRGSVLG